MIKYGSVLKEELLGKQNRLTICGLFQKFEDEKVREKKVFRPKWHHELTGLSIFILCEESPFAFHSHRRNMNYSRNPISNIYFLHNCQTASRPFSLSAFSKTVRLTISFSKKKWKNEKMKRTLIIWRVRHFQWHSLKLWKVKRGKSFTLFLFWKILFWMRFIHFNTF